MPLAGGILDQQNVSSPDDTLLAVAHLNLALPDHEQDILPLRRGMPAT
jgi:hypothetical protein